MDYSAKFRRQGLTPSIWLPHAPDLLAFRPREVIKPRLLGTGRALFFSPAAGSDLGFVAEFERHRRDTSIGCYVAERKPKIRAEPGQRVPSAGAPPGRGAEVDFGEVVIDLRSCRRRNLRAEVFGAHLTI
ncbi:hypothetical protein [Actinoplanes regularis]|uniref:hypothetical protein n=1 Tax=Actinoplanes regularis TaxID=52697 RepID=UPI0024A2EF33|nr:hypothetical protein [Actinoplanes regularis]GLW29051.1 hypothetical protein Areg01_19910 [Actinoplanes regularis]